MVWLRPNEDAEVPETKHTGLFLHALSVTDPHTFSLYVPEEKGTYTTQHNTTQRAQGQRDKMHNKRKTYSSKHTHDELFLSHCNTFSMAHIHTVIITALYYTQCSNKWHRNMTEVQE